MKRLDILKKKKITLIIIYFCVNLALSTIEGHSAREVFVKEDIQVLIITLIAILSINIKYIIKK